MSRANSKTPRCILIAGPNGAGKTTFAREYLPNIARVIHFVNADLAADVLRRFSRGWLNFQRFYRPLADRWTVYDNSGERPRLVATGK